MKKGRTQVLVGLLAVVAALGAFYYGVVWHYERQLTVLGEEWLVNWDAGDERPVAEREEIITRIIPTCSFSHVLYGTPEGKVTLLRTAWPRTNREYTFAINLIYSHEQGRWIFRESYLEHHPQKRSSVTDILGRRRRAGRNPADSSRVRYACFSLLGRLRVKRS